MDLLACLDVARDADAGVFEGRNQQWEYHQGPVASYAQEASSVPMLS